MSSNTFIQLYYNVNENRNRGEIINLFVLIPIDEH